MDRGTRMGRYKKHAVTACPACGTSFGVDTMRELRERLGLGKAAAARLCGYDRARWWNWENGRIKPSAEIVLHCISTLAAVLHMESESAPIDGADEFVYNDNNEADRNDWPHPIARGEVLSPPERVRPRHRRKPLATRFDEVFQRS